MLRIWPFEFSLFPHKVMDWNKKQAIIDGGGYIQGVFGDNDHSKRWTGSSCKINRHIETNFLWWLFVIEY